MTTKEWISLSDMCQGRFGIADAQPHIIQAINIADGIIPDAPSQPIPDYDIFLKQCVKWCMPDDELDLLMACKHLFLPRAVYQFLTVDQIEVKLPYQENPTAETVRIADGQKVIWGWMGQSIATAFYWAFLFHEKNNSLEQPENIWQRLHFLYSAGQYWPQIVLALYERTLGIKYDIREQREHYLKNVVRRTGLNPDELKKRPELIENAVDYLHQTITEQLRLLLYPQ